MDNFTKILQVKAIQINFDETIMNDVLTLFDQHFSYYAGSIDYETGKNKGYYYVNGVHCYNGFYVVKTGSEIQAMPQDYFEANYTKVPSILDKERCLFKHFGKSADPNCANLKVTIFIKNEEPSSKDLVLSKTSFPLDILDFKNIIGLYEDVDLRDSYQVSFILYDEIETEVLSRELLDYFFENRKTPEVIRSTKLDVKTNKELLESVGGDLPNNIEKIAQPEYDKAKEELDEIGKNEPNKKDKRLLTEYKAIAIYSSGKTAEKIFEYVDSSSFGELTCVAFAEFTKRQINAMYELKIEDLTLNITALKLEVNELSNFKKIWFEDRGKAFMQKKVDVSASENEDNQ